MGSASGFGINNFQSDRGFTTKKLNFSKIQKNPMYCGLSRGYFENIVLQTLSQAMIISGKFANDMLDIISGWEFENDDTVYIFNRYFHSELAYSKPMRGYEAIGDPDYDLLEEKMLTGIQDVLLIYVTADDIVLEKRLMQRGDDYVTSNDIMNIKKRYDEQIIPRSKLPVLTIVNNDLPNIEPILNDIRERMSYEH